MAAVEDQGSMRFSETVASQCRYGSNAQGIWGGWDILWEDSEADYQGHAAILATFKGKYCFYEWTYGSCSGCDTWEDQGLTGDQIEMRDTAMWIGDRDQLRIWGAMLDPMISRPSLVQAIREHLATTGGEVLSIPAVPEDEEI